MKVVMLAAIPGSSGNISQGDLPAPDRMSQIAQNVSQALISPSRQLANGQFQVPV